MPSPKFVRRMFERIVRPAQPSESKAGLGAVSSYYFYYWLGQTWWCAIQKDGLWYDVYVGDTEDLFKFSPSEVGANLDTSPHLEYPSVRALLEDQVEYISGL